MKAGLLQSEITVASGPRPKQIEEHQEVKSLKSFIDMHLIKAQEADATLEKVEEVPIRSQKIQSGIFRVPPSLLAQENKVIKDFKDEVLVPEPAMRKVATRKVAVVQELASSKKESDNSHSSNSSLDTDATWETKSMYSRYETYDVFHDGEVEKNVCELPASHLKVKEEHSASVEMTCVNRPVEQSYLVSRNGESLLEEEIWFDYASDLIAEQVFENDL
ncbi:hypothetical protein GOP47_0024221 [Adiantum capillus-veneris]|uniref:Uncharacterized protein n=1 Tax=Adiantum capillus-veneris TaxID=13818 RepID=A0A9D4U514_ADICA|nr:hypothetical protein GOP47_0024221 [Adiantum capillus-veneris]